MESKYARVSSEEYRRLYTELMQRLKSLFSQGYTLMTIVGVVWSLAATTLGMFFDNKLLDFSAEHIWLSLSLSLVIVVLFGLPTLITFPFAVKQLDDLRAVASLAAYTKVFYEIPSMCSSENDEKPDFCGWETLHCEAALSKTKFFNAEYIIAVVLSDILSLCFCIIVGSYIITTDTLVVLLVFAFLYEGMLMFLTVHVFRYSRTVSYIQAYMAEYTDTYIEEALEVQRITKEQEENYRKYMQVVSERDKKMPKKLKIEMKIIRLNQKAERTKNPVRRKKLIRRKDLLEKKKQEISKNGSI